MLAYSFLIFAAGLLPHFINAQNMGLERPSSVVIVELFTSEGCSSCPPADALLRQINLKQTNAGQLMVGISEHVTYWNDLGWKDPFSSAEFTDRQNVYASRLSPEGAGLADFFERQFSVDSVRRFKPAAEVYQLVVKSLEREPPDLCLVAAHPWDTLGAQSVGFAAGLLMRPGNAPLPMKGCHNPK